MRDSWNRFERGVVAAIFLFGAADLGCGFGEHDDDDNMRIDVVECEEAAAHINECCPGVQSLPDCHFASEVTTCSILWIPHSVGTYDSDSTISTDESSSIRKASCADLQAIGVCQETWPTSQPKPDPDDPPTMVSNGDCQCGCW